MCAGRATWPARAELVTTGDYSDYANNRNWFMELGNTGLTLAVDGADGWRRAVRSELGKGADIVKISASAGHGSALPRAARSIRLPRSCAPASTRLTSSARWCGPTSPRGTAFSPARALGVDVIDHADRIDDECIEAILEAGSFVVPSMLWTVRFLEVAENWDHAAASCCRSARAFRRRWRRRRLAFAACGRISSTPVGAMPEAAAAGVKMVVGDDFGTPIMPHGDYNAELELYVKQLGIPALDVIRWATGNGAELMGLGDDAGRIEAGRLADVVVVDGDPLQDITRLSDPANVLAVLKGGEVMKDILVESASPLGARGAEAR